MASPGGTGESFPPETRKIFAKDREQPTIQPAIKIDNRRKFKLLLHCFKYLLKIFKTL